MRKEHRPLDPAVELARADNLLVQPTPALTANTTKASTGYAVRRTMTATCPMHTALKLSAQGMTSARPSFTSCARLASAPSS